MGRLWEGLLDLFFELVTIAVLLNLVGNITNYGQIGQEECYFLGWEHMDLFWLGLRFDEFKKIFHLGVHINVALDLLWDIFVHKFIGVVCVSFYFTELEYNRAGLEDLVYLHFQVHVPFGHCCVGSSIERMVTNGFIVVTVELCCGFIDLEEICN